MEERLKQRLVGAVVLVSLAVVFVPILFDLAPRRASGAFGDTRFPRFPSARRIGPARQ